MKHTYVVIMAGGKGERFWPMSIGRVPKPFLNITGDKTLIRLTIERAMRIVPITKIYIALEREHIAFARRKLPFLPADNFIVEPEERDTAPCIGLAAMTLLRKDSKAVMIVLPADHYITDIDGFKKTVKDGVKVARAGDHLVTIGTRPTRPETGYGYIRVSGKPYPAEDARYYSVERYVEKPDIRRARTYCKDSRYYWNTGVFIWQAKTVMESMKHYMPELYKGLQQISSSMDVNKNAVINRVFKGFTKLSIDYGLMQKAGNVAMVPARFMWDDIGTWASLLRVSDPDGNGNFKKGSIASIDTKGCVINGSDVAIGTIGVSDLVIVATKDSVLVCDIDRVQEVREIAQRLNSKKIGEGRGTKDRGR
ncbi:MAG: Alginate biosynthesis protein AlgA [Syntrophorhabdus sp. PtaU1.Bin058]|nr:MAG: Alginate biosynthesis protein AlgA [Syntrophorhabdus sp. PtaU1.Bin058]